MRCLRNVLGILYEIASGPNMSIKVSAEFAYVVAGSPCVMLPFTGGAEKVRQTKRQDKQSRQFQGRSDRHRARKQ